MRQHRIVWLALLTIGALITPFLQRVPAQSFDISDVDPNALPQVPSDFKVSVFAKEPLIRNPAAIAFDLRGRVYVGGGPQFRLPTRATPPDSVWLLIDANSDGVADEQVTFATGFNCIQSLAWKGRDLWVANAPDLTVVRDLDGDDQADEYEVIFTGLGTLEHGLHGLNWGPDGKLYLSKGDTPCQPDAPQPFRDLMHVRSAAPNVQPHAVFNGNSTPIYRARFETPTDPHTEGGVLRCDPDGSRLEIVCRGLRNPWDIAYDHNFDWLGTDNDPSGGDKVLSPFYGAHFGHHHPWSYNWADDAHLPSAPSCGPFWEGSGVGVAFGDSRQFPPQWRDVWFIGDWLNGTILTLRPRWEGARMVSATGGKPLGIFASAGPQKALFRVTDFEFGPDGALWVCSWGRTYAATWSNDQLTNEGRVYRIWHGSSPLLNESPAWHDVAIDQWSSDDLLIGLDSLIPARRVAAQDELVRRGESVTPTLIARLETGRLTAQQETWAIWALGQMSCVPNEAFIRWATASSGNLRRQAIRVLAHRLRNTLHPIERLAKLPPKEPATEQLHPELQHQLAKLLDDSDPRVRFEVVQAIWQAGISGSVKQLVDHMAGEQDPLVFYAMWNAVSELSTLLERSELLKDARPAVRLGALLGLLSQEKLNGAEVTNLAAADPDERVRKWSTHWLTMTGYGLDSAEKVVAQLQRLDGQGPSSEARIRLLRKLTTLPLDGAQWDWVFQHLFQVSEVEQYLPDLEQQKAWALRALAGQPRALPILWDALFHSMSGVRTVAVDGFDRLGSAAVDFLLDKIAGATVAQREAAEGALVCLGMSVKSWRLTAARAKQLAELGRSTQNPRLRGAALALFTTATEDSDPAWKPLALELAKQAVVDPHPRAHDRVAALSERLGQPLAVVSKHVPPTVDAVLAKLPTASAQRGRELFFQSGGLGCAKCHRLENQGIAFGPDLTTAPARLTPRFVAESIVYPGAVITEGYRTVAIVTVDGRVLTGVITRETASTLELMQSDGQSILIDSQEVEERHPQTVSIMPDNFDDQATDQELADVVAFVLGKPPLNETDKGATRFDVEKHDTEIAIKLGGQPIATYVFRDKKTFRPFFAHLHTTSGIRVTRNHPPIPGVDATDHDTMHPGLWLAFGDLHGNDFWRNVARVEHVRFIEEPQTTQHGLRFVVENRYIAFDQKSEICREIADFSFHSSKKGWMLGWRSKFSSQNGLFYFGAQDEMGLGLRVANELRVDGGSGVILNDRGERNERDTWGKDFRWIDYSGIVGNQAVGVTIVPSPDNTRSCWAHSRDYGVLVANPFPRNGGINASPLALRTLVDRKATFGLTFVIAVHETPRSNPVIHEEIVEECFSLLSNLADKMKSD